MSTSVKENEFTVASLRPTKPLAADSVWQRNTMGPTWGPYGADRTQVGPMLAPWTLLSGVFHCGPCCWRQFRPDREVIRGRFYLAHVFIIHCNFLQCTLQSTVVHKKWQGHLQCLCSKVRNGVRVKLLPGNISSYQIWFIKRTSHNAAQISTVTRKCTLWNDVWKKKRFFIN